MTFYMPTELVTGAGCVSEQANAIAKLGTRCLIVTGGSAAVRSGALAEVENVLQEKQIAWKLYADIAPNPTVSSCMAGGRMAGEFGADFVIGIGGGSPLDAAKAISVFAANPELTEKEFYSALWPKAPLPNVLIGTTAGTGSEVTSVSVLTDSAGRKHSIHDRRLYAALALGDARYTMTLPKSTTLSTGIDAVAHCVESYFSRKADLVSKLFAAEGIRLALPVLKEAVSAETLSPVQRERLYHASILGGMAINRTGTVFPHNVGYYLTEHYGIPHGFASAAFMPELLEHARGCNPERCEALYREAGTSEAELLELVKETVPQRGILLTDEEIRAALPRWENNGSVKNTVGIVSPEQIEKMLKKRF